MPQAVDYEPGEVIEITDFNGEWVVVYADEKYLALSRDNESGEETLLTLLRTGILAVTKKSV